MTVRWGTPAMVSVLAVSWRRAWKCDEAWRLSRVKIGLSSGESIIHHVRDGREEAGMVGAIIGRAEARVLRLSGLYAALDRSATSRGRDLGYA